MKKFTKILAVLMTVCLLFGVVASFGASAKTTASSRLYVVAPAGTAVGTAGTQVKTGNQYRYIQSFDKAVGNSSKLNYITVTKGEQSHQYLDSVSNASVTGDSGANFGIVAGGAGKAYPAGLFHDKTTADGYLAIRKVAGSFDPDDSEVTFTTGTKAADAAPEWHFSLSHNSSVANATNCSQNLNLVKYATVDFDYGTDRWAYKIGDAWQTGTTVPAGATDVRPANAAGTIALEFSFLNGTAYAKDSKNKNANRLTNYGSLVVCKDAATGNFFLSSTASSYKDDTEYSAGDMWLSNQPGLLDHFTYTIAVATDAGAKITQLDVNVFVNGVYFKTWTATPEDEIFSTAWDDAVIYGLYTYAASLAAEMDDGSYTKTNDCYSLVFDNIAPNYYRPADYTYTTTDVEKGVYGLDQYMANETYKTVNLANCPDTLYGIYETRDDAIVVVDGIKHKVVGSSVDLGGMISNDADVKLPAGKAFTASPAADVESFSVTLGDGSTLAINGVYKLAEGDAGACVADKIDVKANASLTSDMSFNLYIDSNDFDSDLFNLGGLEARNGDIEGKSYKVITYTPELKSFASTKSVLYTGTSVGGVSVSSDIKLDLVKYATLVADTFACNSPEAKLAYEIMDYKAAVAKYLDPEFDASKVASLEAFYAIYDDHADGCTCKVSEEIEYPAIESGAIAEKLISFALLDSGKFAVIFEGFNEGDNVSITIGEGKDAYIKENIPVVSGKVIFDDINAALLHFTFNVTVNGEAGQYRLSSYIKALEGAPAEDLAIAMYEYSVAVYNFKTAPIN